MKIKSATDFWAGAMFLGFGVFFVVVAGNYQMGSAVRMGPAYFPTVLGGVLALLGLMVLTRSFVRDGAKVPMFHFRPLLFILVACLAFGYLLKPFGLIVALLALVFISAFGGHDFKIKEVTVLCLVLIIFSVLVFVKGLTQPFPIWPALID